MKYQYALTFIEDAISLKTGTNFSAIRSIFTVLN